MELESVESAEDIEELKQLIQQHADYTGSTVALGILESWAQSLSQFVKVMPRDYKRALAEMAAKAKWLRYWTENTSKKITYQLAWSGFTKPAEDERKSTDGKSTGIHDSRQTDLF